MSHEPPPEGDTIVAISTPPGRGGIGVVRISGPRSIAIASSLFRPAASAAGGNGAGGPERSGAAAATPRILFGRFGSRTDETIDHGYLVTFDPPRTFTGEPTAELWTHGSVAVLRCLVQEAVARGARPATPGEFTLRAFLNGRIDVTQAEAIRDLIEARTSFQAQVAHDQVEGRISRAVDRLKDRLTEVIARVEAAIEFSEEAEAERFAPEGGILQAVRTLVSEMERLAGTYERGRWVREGASVAIVGAPNAGKSSLFNRLLEEDRAIVTPVAGTTRDVIEETLDLGGIPVRLTDTAGIHEPRDEADAEAVRRARAALAGADLRLVALDWSRDLREGEREMLRDLGAAPAIVVFNKCDLPRGVALDQVLSLRRRRAAFEVSARSGEGIGDLRRRLAEAIAGGPAVSREEIFLTNVRHRDLVTKAAAALRRAETAAREGAGEEYVVLDLKDGLDSLGEITGAVGIEAIHEAIFRSFCIGK